MTFVEHTFPEDGQNMFEHPSVLLPAIKIAINVVDSDLYLPNIKNTAPLLLRCAG
jgi:hypothetical protein